MTEYLESDAPDSRCVTPGMTLVPVVCRPLVVLCVAARLLPSGCLISSSHWLYALGRGLTSEK